MNGAGSQSLPAGSLAAASDAGLARPASSLPWYAVAVVLASACLPIGVLWDISWHTTIGRDSFWTPAHILIYAGGAVPGCLCGWVVLRDTFRPPAAGPVPGVRLWGFRGPIGAWVVIWGAFAMLVSAPFDNWWHNAYGLDVKIISPPHTLLALGTYAVAIGGMLMVLAWQNRAGPDRTAGMVLLYLIGYGTLLTKQTVFTTEYTYPNQQHTALFYQVACAMFPLWMVVAARASNLRWAATGTAAVYMATLLAMVWILPLFPGHPKLAPIYNPVDHMVPPPFPLLLVIPAVGVDLLMLWFGPRRGFWRDTGLALLVGLVFFLLLLVTQWPSSEFLLSPAARNPLFAGNAMWGYGADLGDWCTRFWDVRESPLTVRAAVIAVLLGAAQARVALWIGNWSAVVKR